KKVIQRYGCGSCHRIPGISGADSLVGPSLERIASRIYIAGHLINEPNAMIAWIREPEHLRSPTAMPTLGVTEQEARDIAAYLYLEVSRLGAQQFPGSYPLIHFETHGIDDGLKN